MKKREFFELAAQMQNIYSGILFNYRNFDGKQADDVIYDFSCPEYAELREKYELVKIAGKGSEFQKAKRLLHYFAPKLTHSSWYDNHVECNALKLLEYSFDNPEQGINCLNKSKILEECCLALGIYARRVRIMPFSPYDFDNHVVNEIFDKKLNKWIMLDMTTDGYFVDENNTPLSLLEMRDKFANDEFVTFVKSTDRLTNLEKSRSNNVDKNYYICKNLFYFTIGAQCKFGQPSDWYDICPSGYSLKDNKIANIKYRINHLPSEYKDWIPQYEERLKNVETAEYTVYDAEIMRRSPLEQK